MSTPSYSSRGFRVNLWLHRWTSLIATLPFLILCLTGAVLIFHEEIDHLLGVVPEVNAVAEGQSPQYDRSVSETLVANPGERLMSVGLDPERPGIMLLATALKNETSFNNAKLRYTDLNSGLLVGDPAASTTLTGFLLELHAQWFLGPVGELVGAFIALLILISVISGVVIYAPYAKKIAFGVLRRGRSARLLQLDLHNFAGVVVLGWLLVVAFTGFLLGFASIAVGIWQMSALAEYRTQFNSAEVNINILPAAKLSKVVEVANATADTGWQVSNVIYPATEFSTQQHFTVLLRGGEGIEQSLFKVLLVDGNSGEVAKALTMPLYFKAILLAEPLHFGNYGGLFLKILWTICALLTFFITANGAWLWWDRRKPKSSRTEEVTA
jgi:uncharacterized iron-regulated membrane protein